MSALYGEARFDGAAPDAAAVAAIEASAGYWGPDGRALWRGAQAALGQFRRHDTPEACFDAAPSAESGVAFAAWARLDNRDELLRAFGIDAASARVTADSTLVRLAYRRWGVTAAEQLFGDWQFAAWHASERRLLLARDPNGYSSLHFHLDDPQRPRRLRFAPTRAALHATGIPRTLDELYLAQGLISWADQFGPRTIDRHVLRLPPGHWLRVDPNGIDLHRYWYPERVPLLPIASLDEAVEGFLPLFQAAVASRCRSIRPLASTLSGGLDSGAVTALAARRLRQRGESLIAYTHVPLVESGGQVGPGRFGDERWFAAATARHLGNVEHRLLDSAHLHPLDGIEQSLVDLDQPMHAASNAFWIVDLLQTVRAEGQGVLLTGQGGNGSISWQGAPHLTGLFAMLRLQGMRRTLQHHLPAAWVRPLKRWRARRNGFSHTAINPDFARRIGLAELRADSHGRQPFDPPRDGREARCAFLQPGHSKIGELWSHHGAMFGLSVRDPTADVRVLNYTLSLPDHLFYHPGGMDRRLIREAMRGVLPDDVRLNTDRGRQSADLVDRLRRDAARMQSTLDRLARSAAADYVSLATMRAAWQRVLQHNDANTNHRAGTVLLRGLAAALWIDRR